MNAYHTLWEHFTVSELVVLLCWRWRFTRIAHETVSICCVWVPRQHLAIKKLQMLSRVSQN